MRRIGLDQTTAWMLAVFFAVVAFGGLYGVTKMGAADSSGEDGHHDSSHGDDPGKHRVEADDPHGEAAKGHAEEPGAGGVHEAAHEATHETTHDSGKDDHGKTSGDEHGKAATEHVPPPAEAHGEHPAADKHHK